jgi:hypothetical protein
MTSRLLERSTAMIDQVADAVAGIKHAMTKAEAKNCLRMRGL